MFNSVKEIKKIRAEQNFFGKHGIEITKKKIELKDNKEKFDKWYDDEFQKFIREQNLVDLFTETNLPMIMLPGNPEVITVDPKDIVEVDVIEKTMENIKSAVSQAADSLQNNEIIEPQPVKKGLIFDHLVVPNPEAAAELDHGAHTIKVEEGAVQRTLFDNSQIISKFPDMGRIQDIIRTTEGWDVEMLPLYNDFIVNTLYVNGVATNKVFIVDYKGEFMNSLPKIFLINGGFVDESEAIHLSDGLNLINYLKGVQITQPQEQIVTPEQRRIARYIVNYGTPLVHERFRNKFESICIEKVIPFLENIILPNHPDASFAIDTFKDSTHWTLTCTPNVPYRFGESGGSCKSVIYIQANGLDNDGHLLITPTFG